MDKSNVVLIDARAAGYQGDAVRILAITMADSGKIQIAKLAKWGEPVKKKDRSDKPNGFNRAMGV